MKKILYVSRPNYVPLGGSLVEFLRDKAKVIPRSFQEQALSEIDPPEISPDFEDEDEIYLRHLSNDYSGVFIDSLEIPLLKPQTRNKTQNPYETGIEIVRKAKEKGLPVVVLTDPLPPGIQKTLEDLEPDAVFTHPIKTQDYIPQTRRIFGLD
ncbi:hypothetical protein HOD75_01220 [archaeon]|jgi:hypothetical protein|nr:hypothetical protein [archaeon]MBT4241499.1 hypothetical protein [archaeon]MBT4417630.1 hypothetical protein [archaeon]